jgi:beta-lactam-binding protein with PASTA domain/Ca2+-binding RTX toxin-like protein
MRSRRWAAFVGTALVATVGLPIFTPTVTAQTAPVGNGFVLVDTDLRFIFHQIEVAQNHAAPPTSTCPGCGTLLGPGVNQVNLFGTPNAQLPLGLRTVDGSFNNLVTVPDQHMFGAADLVFPRLTTPNYRAAEPMTISQNGQPVGSPTSYSQKSGFVTDSQPRIISNLIVDQTANNPAAFAAAQNPCGSGGFVCQGNTVPDPITGSLFIPNITPDFGLSAPFNLMFAFFGQFFDHGLDLVTKGGGTVIMPLRPDDPLFVQPTAANPNPPNFMVMTRATNLPGPDGILGTADDIQEGVNTTTPWVDQNQTYTSHPSHQVFLRQYETVTTGKPLPDGKVLDGGFCAKRADGGADICDVGNWNEVKAQAATKLGIKLVDQDVFDVPLLLTDPYGHFKPGPHGYPQLVLPGPGLLEGDPTANGGQGVTIPANAFHTGHAFLNDIAHSAEPDPGLVPDNNTVPGTSLSTPHPGTYDALLLGRHFVTGDGRGNENIGLTTMHNIFHAEHNRLVADIDKQINALLTPAEIAKWHAVDAGSGWGYGERLFQAARFITEMEYQHIVFEEFARKMQPLINPFLGGITSINPAISAEFAHTVYRLGHSMLPEVVSRIGADGTKLDMRLFDAFLNPVGYNNPPDPAHPGQTLTLTANLAAGSIVRGLSRQVGNELDEFIEDSVRNTLVGLPLDLAATNIARGRSEGIPSLNSARRQFFAATKNSALTPYANWFEFGLNLKHPESLINFVAAYGTDPTITGVATVVGKRAAAATLVAANGAFMFAPSATSGLDNVDFWVGGLAERQAAFGGLLGSTFNYVFEKQLEDLQNGDRFYYLQRLDGVALRFQLEGNSLAEMARRNTDVGDTMANIFSTADFNFDLSTLTGTAPVDLGDGAQLLTLVDGTKLFFDPLHKGKNVMFNGSAGDDRMQGDIGDDTFYGNAGNDRIEGNDGNDRIYGGDGDDIIFGGNGDDFLEGGPGNDAISSGPGFGGDLVIGGDGNDFLLGGDDGVEYFAGPGNDIVVDGAQRAEGIFGGPGDDWIDAGDGHDGGIFGDNGNVFDLLADIGAIGGMTIEGGDDVLDGGPGQDNHFGEGGDDIMLMSEGTNKFFGDYGFDWVTMRGWPAGADHAGVNGPSVDLDLLVLPNTPLNFNDLRNVYRLMDGASGWNFNDELEGDSRTNDTTLAPELQNLPGMELTVAGAAKIAGLTQFMRDLGAPLPFNAGNILLGGLGSDLIEGRGGDDLIDGDLWLNVQLRAVMNDGTVKLVDGPRDLVADVFSDPQRLNPGNITIVRTIVTPAVPAPDCPALPAPVGTAKNCDTAVYQGPRSNYAITSLAGGVVRVTALGPVAGIVGTTEGTDTLRNIERIQFADGTINAPSIGGGNTTVPVPNVVGLPQAAAALSITQASLVASATSANNPTVAIGNVISQSPAAGVSRPFGSTVSIVVALGALAPNVVALSQAAATSIITNAGMTLGGVTLANSTIVAGIVISQSPPAGTTVQPGSPMALVISLGPANVTVPNVVNQTQANAITAITGVGLVQGTVTTAASTTVAVGSVISQSPAGGTSATPGSAVNLVIAASTDAPVVAAAVTRSREKVTAANPLTSPSITVVGPNTLLVAFVAADASPTGANTTVTGVTNTGVALTWTNAARSNVQRGTSEIWYAYSTPAHLAMTVTAALSANQQAATMTVIAVTGADPTVIGAIGNGANGAPRASLLTTRSNSLVFGVGNDFSNGRTMVPGAGETALNQFVPIVNDTYWVQRITAPIATAGSLATIIDTYAGTMTDVWNLALVEIRRP